MSAEPPFPLLPRAENVRVFPERGNGEWFFTLEESYPADDVVHHYERYAASQGWAPCAVPQMGTWSSVGVMDANRTEFRLARVWADMPRHQAVMLFVRYKEPGDYRESAPRSETLYVNVLLVPVTEGKDPCDAPPAEGRLR